MEMYNLHDTAPTGAYTRRRFLQFKTYAGIAAVLGVMGFVVLSYWPTGERQDVGAPLMPTKAVKPQFMASPSVHANTAPRVPRSRPGKASVLNRHRDEVMRSVNRREMASKVWRVDPFAFSMPGARVGIGSVNMRDIFEELEHLSEEIEDEMNAKRAVRQVYQEELEKLRKLRADKKRQRMGKSPEISEMPLASTGEQLRGQDGEPNATPAPIASMGTWQLPQLSLSETAEAYEYSLQLDGMNAEDVRLTLHDNVLSIGGRKFTEFEDGHYTSEFKRSLTLPEDAKLDTLESAEAIDGQLLLRVEKVKPKLPSSREILIERMSAADGMDTEEVPTAKASADGPDAILAAASEKSTADTEADEKVIPDTEAESVNGESSSPTLEEDDDSPQNDSPQNPTLDRQ